MPVEMIENMPILFGAIGGWELFMIFLVVLLVFGAKRLPEIARSMGLAINEFKKTKDNIMNYTEDSKTVKPAEKATEKDTSEADYAKLLDNDESGKKDGKSAS